MHIISQGPKWVKVRATHNWIMKRLYNGWLDPNRPLGTPHVSLDTSGHENLMYTCAKAYYHGGGVWLISGYAPDSSDVTALLF